MDTPIVYKELRPEPVEGETERFSAACECKGKPDTIEKAPDPFALAGEKI
jgi:hypothetical protein